MAVATKAPEKDKPVSPQPEPTQEPATTVAMRPKWADFEAEIRRRETEISTLLPTHISREKFVNTAVIAAKNNPDLLICDRRSLHAAITKAAEDGLQPDGREGVINVYNEKRKINGKDVWIKVACWIPMTWGIRKRARELCGMIIDAQIVHENDKFTWQQGDNPSIDHEPTSLADDPGKRIGVYAIFKQDGIILHREVMRAKQVLDVKSVVKAQNGLLWTKFEDEAWRKTALRRGIKTVPSVPEALSRIVSRDDDQYEFQKSAKTIEAAVQSFDIPDADESKRTQAKADVDIPDDVDEKPPIQIADYSAALRELQTKLQQSDFVGAANIEQEYAEVIKAMDEDSRTEAIDMIEAAKAGVL